MKIQRVRFELSKALLRLAANNPEQESAEEVLDVDYDGADLEVGFNIGYLIDVLSVLEEESVKFEFYGEDSRLRNQRTKL